MFIFCCLSSYGNHVVVSNNTKQVLSVIELTYAEFIEIEKKTIECSVNSVKTLVFDSKDSFVILVFKNQRFVTRFYMALDCARVPIFIDVNQGDFGLQINVKNDPYVSGWALFEKAMVGFRELIMDDNIAYDKKVSALEAFANQYQNFFPERSLYALLSHYELKVLSDTFFATTVYEGNAFHFLKDNINNHYTKLLQTPILSDWIFHFVTSYMLDSNFSCPNIELKYQACFKRLNIALDQLGIQKDYKDRILQTVYKSTGYSILHRK
jgi:hypothetical protein